MKSNAAIVVAITVLVYAVITVVLVTLIHPTTPTNAECALAGQRFHTGQELALTANGDTYYLPYTRSHTVITCENGAWK